MHGRNKSTRNGANNEKQARHVRHLLFFLSRTHFCHISCATGTTMGYENIAPEFIMHLGPLATNWLEKFLSRILNEQNMPKIWRKAMMIAIFKPGKERNSATIYLPISLLSF